MLLEENHRLVRKSLNAAAKEEEVVAQKITIAFIQSTLQADTSDRSGEDDLTRASPTDRSLAFDVLDETDLSYQNAVKNRVLASLENDVENYTFPSISKKMEIMQASTSKISKHDADPVAKPVKKKIEVEVIEYKAEVPEAEEEDKTEEKLAEALEFLKKVFGRTSINEIKGRN